MKHQITVHGYLTERSSPSSAPSSDASEPYAESMSSTFKPKLRVNSTTSIYIDGTKGKQSLMLGTNMYKRERNE